MIDVPSGKGTSGESVDDAFMIMTLHTSSCAGEVHIAFFS